MDSNRTVFIAYRRTNIYIARAIFQNLVDHDFDVFIDYASIDSGSFDRIILNQISARVHFLLVLSPSSVERLRDPNDWLRYEIEHALESKRNIVPLMVEGFDFRDAKEYFTGKLSIIPQYNAILISPDYFDEAMLRLRDRFLSQPLETVLHPLVNDQVQMPVGKVLVDVQKLAVDTSSEPDPQTKKILRDQVFISYSHQDKIWLNKFRKILRPVERINQIKVWADTEIGIGDKWREKIREALGAAKIAVLLVSPDFLASDFINDEELPTIFQASEKEGLLIIWIPISASLYDLTFMGVVKSGDMR